MNTADRARNAEEAKPVEIQTILVRLLQGGLGNLAAYLAAHVLLCLVPAFFLAGGMSALIPKESVTRFLGRGAPKYISYPAAALALLAENPHPNEAEVREALEGVLCRCTGYVKLVEAVLRAAV